MTPYELAKAEIGTVEWSDGSNPKILGYYADAGHKEVRDDAVPWCAAFVGAMIARASGKPSGLLSARSYLQWGQFVSKDDAMAGDVVVFTRGNSKTLGHVAFFVSWNGDKSLVTVLGGNQSDAVNLRQFASSAILGIRRDPKIMTSTVAAAQKLPPSKGGNIFGLLKSLFSSLGKRK